MALLRSPLLKTVLGAAAGEAIGRKTAGRGLLGAGIGLVATRIAMRSVPGALIVGGGLLAKAVLDARRKPKPGRAAAPAQADSGPSQLPPIAKR